MTYWHETVHDDVFLIMNDGWVEAAKPHAARIIGHDQNQKPKYENAHIQFGTGAAADRYVMDLIPPAIMAARYFAEQRAKVEHLISATEEASRAVEEYVEEHAVEDGLLWQATDNKGKVTQKSAAARYREAQAEGDDEALEATSTVIDLLTREAAAKKAAKNALLALNLATLKKYGDLTELDVKALVLEDKWHAVITARITDELDYLTLKLVGRIRQLGERYGETLDDIESEVAELNARVAAHLTDMGIK
jgi:type I restriction enzyme M protein